MLSNEREDSSVTAAAAPPHASPSAAPFVTDRAEERAFVASWMEKRAEWRFAWDRRYVTLDGNRMAYRVEEGGPEKRSGTVASLDCNTDKSDLVFRVWLLEGGSWTLRAPDLTLYERWLEALLTVLQPSGSSVDDTTVSKVAIAPLLSPRLPSPGRALSSENPITDHGSGGVSPFPCRASRKEDGSLDTSATSSATSTPPQSRPSTGGGGGGGGGVWGPIQLTAHVEKQAAWTGRWKSRVLELYDGNQLAYKAKATSGVRQRYSVTAVDLAVRTDALSKSSNHILSSQVNRLLLITTSVGERFWVRFASADECQEWHRAIYHALQRLCSWQWMPLLEDVSSSVPLLPDGLSRSVTAAANLVLDGNGSHNYSSLRVHHHCAAVAPLMASSGGDWPGGMGQCLYIYGGSDRVCKGVHKPQVHAAVPSARSGRLLSSLSCLQLFGSHAAQTLPVLPFEERPHAKVRPPPLLGATMSSVYKKTTGVQLNRISVSAVQVVVVGGMTNDHSMAGLSSSAVWSAVLSPPTHLLADGVNTIPTPQFQRFWRKTTFPTYELPSLVFHSATDVSGIVEDTMMKAGREEKGGGEAGDAPTAAATLLLTGGLDEHMRTRAECYLLRWPYYETAEQEPAAPSVSFFGFLPEPRAFHGSVTLKDGTVVLVGGRGVLNGDVTPVLTLPPFVLERLLQSDDAPQTSAAKGKDDATAAGNPDAPASPWLRVQWHQDQWALPPMPDATVAATESGDRVVVLSQLMSPRTQVKLFVMTFREAPDSTGGGERLPQGTMQVLWREIALSTGAIPRSVVGASLHISNGYLYVLGCSDSENAEGTAEEGASVALDAAVDMDSHDDGERLYVPLRVLMSPA